MQRNKEWKGGWGAVVLLLPLAVQAQSWSKTETLEYQDDTALWVLGQVKRITTDGVETSRTTYGWKALPTQSFSFGKLQQTLTYDSTSAVASGTVIKYPHTDALGTPIAVTDASRAIVETSEYEPYGQLSNRPLTDGLGFTGHVQDAATGLTYMQQRYYDPTIGRFLSVDPVTAYSSPGANFNRYWYANNNPYRFTDPDGRFPSYLVSRPLQGTDKAQHNFIVHHAAFPGDPNGTVRSWGDTGNDTMGEVTLKTKGYSEGTHQTDRNAWESIGKKGSNATYRQINASDDAVKKNADNLKGGSEYSLLPDIQGGVNSNSAAGAVAHKSDNGSRSVDNGKMQPGSSKSAVSRVQFKDEKRKDP